jgi:hypothetical protein
MRKSARGEVLRWYRNRTWIWSQSGVFGGITILVGGGMAVTLAALGGGRDWQTVGFFLAFAAWGILALAAGFRAGLGICQDGVLIRQTSGWTRWVPWTEIERFDVVPKYTRAGKWMSVVVVFAGRKPLPISACSFYGREIPAMLSALENERISASDHEPPGQPHMRLHGKRT